MIEEVPVEDIEEAVDEYVNAMSLDDLLTYVRSNMKDYYVNVADFEEVEEFLESNRDTSVYVGVQTLENSGVDRRVDLILTEAGMEWQMPECHAIWS